MFKFISAFLPFIFASACVPDERVSSGIEPTIEYNLIDLDGAPFDGTATISFPEPGKVVGQAPCNRYFATQTEPYPWFSLEGIGATRMACPDLNVESSFFAALEEMTLSEVSGDTLILSNTDGRQMVFVAR